MNEPEMGIVITVDRETGAVECVEIRRDERRATHRAHPSDWRVGAGDSAMDYIAKDYRSWYKAPSWVEDGGSGQ